MKTYLITGATGGLGLELVKTALNDGHRVIAAVRNPDALAELVQAYPNQLQTERFNAADNAQFQTLADKYPQVDVLINNAGGSVLGAMEELTDEQVEQQLTLNLRTPIYLTRAFLPAMRAKQSGTLVYITSIGGRVGFASGVMYHAAKFGLEGFAEALAQEVADFGIKTLIIEPGSMKTRFVANVNWAAQSEAYHSGTTVGKMRDYIQNYGEDSVAGDPVKIARAVIDLTTADTPPLRTALGTDTYAVLEQAYAKSVTDLKAQEELAKSVAFEGKIGFMPNS